MIKVINPKSNKGVTLMVLIITLVIMLIMMVTVTININGLGDRKHRTNLMSDMTKLKEEIDYYYSKNKELPLANKYINTEALTKLQAVNILSINDSENYFIIDLSQMRDLELNYGNDFYTIEDKTQDIDDLLDIYIINEQSHMIYYPKGIYYQGQFLYTTLDSKDFIADVPLADIKVEDNQKFQVARHTRT